MPVELHKQIICVLETQIKLLLKEVQIATEIKFKVDYLQIIFNPQVPRPDLWVLVCPCERNISVLILLLCTG